MEKMTLASKTLVKDTRGANLVEYILLVGLVAIVCLVGFRTFGQTANDKIQEQADSVNGIPG
jgi:pilus assembly protein Flp/PilA